MQTIIIIYRRPINCDKCIIFKYVILDSFNNQSQTDVIYTDMNKSFDLINHKLLINKLIT